LPVVEKAIRVPDCETARLSLVNRDPYVTMNTTRENVVPSTGNENEGKVSQAPDTLHDASIKRLIE